MRPNLCFVGRCRGSLGGSALPAVGGVRERTLHPPAGETLGGDVLGVCTHACVGDGECTRGWACLATSGGTDLCQCERSNEICDGADNDCNGIIDDAAGGVCSCPAGMTGCGVVCSRRQRREHFLEKKLHLRGDWPRGVHGLHKRESFARRRESAETVQHADVVFVPFDA